MCLSRSAALAMSRSAAPPTRPPTRPPTIRSATKYPDNNARPRIRPCAAEETVDTGNRAFIKKDFLSIGALPKETSNKIGIWPCWNIIVVCINDQTIVSNIYACQRNDTLFDCQVYLIIMQSEPIF